MPRLNTLLYKSIVLVVLSIVLVSCGGLKVFNSSAGDSEEIASQQEQISALETKVMDLKQALADARFLNNKKDAQIVTLQNSVLNLEKQIALEKESAPPKKNIQYKVEYTSPPVLYKKARNLLIEEDYTNAAGLFTQFIKNHPKDSLADNAVYWLAECYYSLGQYGKAILIFQDLEKNYPKSEKVPDAILKLGYSYISIDDTNRAHHHLKRVIKRYPFSPAAEKAQDKLRSFE